ncbi:unnamed protein product [Mucor hiemalis]
MSSFEERRLRREKRVDDYMKAWKQESSDEMVRTSSVEDLIITLESHFSPQLYTTRNNSLENNEYTTTFAKICDDNLKAVCNEHYAFSIGSCVRTTVSEKMSHCVEKFVENFAPNNFTSNHLSYDEDMFARIDFIELVFEDYISPCEDNLYDICRTAIIESNAINLIDDTMMKNDNSAAFMYVINMACENVISMLERKVPKTILNFFESMYDRELSDVVLYTDDQMEVDIYNDFELTVIEIADCIYSEVDYFVSLAFANAVVIMYHNSKSQITDESVNYLITDFASMGV